MNIKRILFKILKYSSLIAWVLIMVLPVITIVFGAFKTGVEFNKTMGITPPESFLNFDNFINVIQEGEIIKGFINSFILVMFGVFGSVLIGSMVAYVINRFEFRFKKTIIFLYLLVSIVPLEISQVSTFKIIDAMGIYNSRIAPIILYIGADVLMVYIYLGALEKIPKDFDRAALLEGANYFQVFKGIILPLLKPATATICMLKTIAIYNDFYIPFLYMPGENLHTVSTTIFRFIGPENTEWQLICALIIISLIPMIILFLFLQKYIYNGITMGGIR